MYNLIINIKKKIDKKIMEKNNSTRKWSNWNIITRQINLDKRKLLIIILSLSLLQEETVNHDRSLINIIPVPGHQHTSCTLETLRNNVLRVLRCALLHIEAILEYGTVIFPPWPYPPPPPPPPPAHTTRFRLQKRDFFFFFFRKKNISAISSPFLRNFVEARSSRLHPWFNEI